MFERNNFFGLLLDFLKRIKVLAGCFGWIFGVFLLFCLGPCREVSVADCEDGLDGPVEAGHIYLELGSVEVAEPHDPVIVHAQIPD